MIPVNPTTLLGLLSHVPDGATAIIQPEQNIRITYGNLKQQVQDVAEALAAAGVSRGDRVGMALPNGLANVVTFLAASMAGTAAPLNPAYKEEEFRFYIEDTNARVLLLPPEGNDEARRAAGDRVPTLTVEMDESGKVSLAGVASRKPAAVPEVTDTALILHTSGSTGRPERVPLSHANLSISSGNVARSYALSKDDVSLCVMPLFHVHGLVASTLATLSTGGTVVVPQKFSPLSFWRIARDHGATWYSAVPTIHQLLLARADKNGTRPAGAEKLRFIRSCSASLPPQVMLDLEAAFGAPVLEALRNDRGRASDVVESVAAGATAPGIGGSWYRREDQHHGQRRPSPCDGRAGRGRDPGTERGDGVREQPGRQRDGVHRWMVQDRRSGLPRREWVSDAHRTAEGDDQSRRREDFAPRDRRSAARAPGRCRGRVLRGAARDVGRRSRGSGGRPARERIGLGNDGTGAARVLQREAL
jgi:acyl-CoA synthetase (AMP-forming)/AMP-acid ligase II